MKKIQIPIFITNEASNNLDDMGMDYSLEMTDVVDYTFYKIDFIAPYKDDDGKEYGMLGIGSHIMISPWSCSKLEKEIEKHL